MLDTTCSVTDAESRGRECAAPTLSNGNLDRITSVSEPSPLRDYLVDQLVIAARYLTETHIFRKDPALPLCQLCLMSGLNGRPIPHLSSCPVGRVLRAIEELGCSSHLTLAPFASAVAAEVARARKKFPGTKNVTVALVEEVGELSKALLDHSYGKAANDSVYGEAVQVSAMAQRVAEEGDPGFPYIPPKSVAPLSPLSIEQQETALAFLRRIPESREILLYAPDFGEKVAAFLEELA